MRAMAWIKKVLGFDVKDRVTALEKRQVHNRQSVQGAINAFKQFAKDAER